MTLRSYNEWASEHVLTTANQSGNLQINIGGMDKLGPLGSIVGNAMQSQSLKRILIAGIVGWFIFMFLFVFPSVDSFAVIVPLFCLGPIIVGAVILGAWHLLMSTLFDTPDLLLSGVLLRRGDEVQIEYRQNIKRTVTFKVISFNLILRESATYDQGTTTATETHDNVIWSDTLMEVAASPENGIDHKVKIKIPDTAMHSFNAPRNSLVWMLNVAIEVPNFPDYYQSYPLMLIPEVSNER